MAETEKRSIIPAERQERIVWYVKARGSASVTELAKIFEVTNETIRRDLAVIEDQGKLLRRRGGAVSGKVALENAPWMERNTQNIEAKTAIALEAAKCIEEGDSVLFDASTTVLQLVKVLPDISITAITNSQAVAAELATKEKAKVIVLGGILDRPTTGTMGPLTERMLKTYHVDKAFLSCAGIHVMRGVTEVNETIGQLKAAMIAQAAVPYLLADHTKFESISLTIFAEISIFHQIITDSNVHQNVVRAFEKYNLPLVIAPPAHESIATA